MSEERRIHPCDGMSDKELADYIASASSSSGGARGTHREYRVRLRAKMVIEYIRAHEVTK